MKFWRDLEARVRSLRQKYSNAPRKAALRLALWGIRALFKPRLFEVDDALRSTEEARVDGTPKILFFLRGGLGDVAMAATYLKELRRFSECADCRFLVAPTNSLPAARSIFRGFANVEVVDLAADLETKIYNEQYLRDFDAWIDLIRFPSLKRWNPETFAVLAPKLGEYLERLERFNKEREKLTLAWPNVDYIKVAFSLANGQNRRSQPDFDKSLEMSDATRPLMTLDETAFDALAKNGLDARPYLTLQRGVDVSYQGANNTRMWPKPYYERLIETIKAEFPEFAIVQLGKADPASDLTGVDVDLRGRTTFEELKALLKNSALHLDGECGMVHFAHSLNSRCAVFFAQTNVDFCGYPENINVKVDGVCPISCEWVVDDWQDRCPRGFEAPPCMTRLTPEFFFDAIRPTLREIVERPKFVWERVDEAAAQTIANVGDSDGKNAETATLFLGEFDRETLLEARREGKRVFWFALRTTPKEIVEARAAGIDADWADATNVPLRDATCDRVFCDVEEPSECVRREILRITKTGGTARFGRSGGVWRKTVKKSTDN
jgi:ADP-heptose:LPS heptosyltransferase